MEIDAEAKAKGSKVDEGGDSWSDTSGDYSVVSDGGASASAESTTEEVPKGQLTNHFAKEGAVPKRRFTHCPEKKTSCTHLESYPRRASSRSKPAFKRGRFLRNRLETIFEHPVVTADNKIVFLRQRCISARCKRRLGFSKPRRFARKNCNPAILDDFYPFAGARQQGAKAVKKSVEEVDQLMMNLDIQQENPVI